MPKGALVPTLAAALATVRVVAFWAGRADQARLVPAGHVSQCVLVIAAHHNLCLAVQQPSSQALSVGPAARQQISMQLRA